LHPASNILFALFILCMCKSLLIIGTEVKA
jgi:hypothetical protein